MKYNTKKVKKVKPTKPFKRKAWKTAILGILMFISWLVQNIYISDLNEIKQQMRSDSQFIATENGNSLQRMIKFQEELRKNNADIDVVANTSRGYFHSMKKVLEAAVRIRPNSEILNKHLLIFTEHYNKFEQSFKKTKM